MNDAIDRFFASPVGLFTAALICFVTLVLCSCIQ